MGKCSKCQNKQASYCDPADGPGRYCKQCAGTVPGVVSRWQKDQWKKRVGSGVVKEEATLFLGKRARVDGGPPISLALLGDSPFLVELDDEDFLEQRVSTVELLEGAQRESHLRRRGC